jgi:hypothetical protein
MIFRFSGVEMPESMGGNPNRRLPYDDDRSCILLAAILDRRCAEGKIYGQVGVILFSIIAMLSGARSYRRIHALIRARLCVLNAAISPIRKDRLRPVGCGSQ